MPVSYAELQKLVKLVPPGKLPVVYEFLAGLVDPEAADASLKPTEFMRLPLQERRRIMKQQAASMVTYYENTAEERELWHAITSNF